MCNGCVTEMGGGENKDAEPSFTPGPFDIPTEYTAFMFSVEGKAVFVNPHYLAQWSPYFATLCFGDFAEGKSGHAELIDTSYEDFVELLLVIGADIVTGQKDIDMTNCLRMLILADKWNIDLVHKNCIHFLENLFPHLPSSFLTTVDLLMWGQQSRVSTMALKNIASRLAGFGLTLLSEQKVFSKLDDMWLVAAIAAAAAVTEPENRAVSDRYVLREYKSEQCICTGVERDPDCRLCTGFWDSDDDSLELQPLENDTAKYYCESHDSLNTPCKWCRERQEGTIPHSSQNAHIEAHLFDQRN